MPEKPEPDSRTIAEGLRSLAIFFAELTQQDAKMTYAPPAPGDATVSEQAADPAENPATTLADACEVWLNELLRAVGVGVSEIDRSGITAEVAVEATRQTEPSDPSEASQNVAGEIAGTLHMVQGG